MTITVSMSAVWLERLTILCIYWTAMIDAENKGVEWKGVGEAVTIQCRSSDTQEYLTLKMGLHEEFDIFFKESNSTKNTVAKEFTGRLQSNGAFPNMDILIKNLTLSDTGPYWCVYKTYDAKRYATKIVKGAGSVLLVVTGRGATPDPVLGCDTSHQSLVLVSVVISGVVLLGIIIGFLIWIILKNKRTRVKPRPVPSNDVYEDMRGTIRR